MFKARKENFILFLLPKEFVNLDEIIFFSLGPSSGLFLHYFRLGKVWVSVVTWWVEPGAFGARVACGGGVLYL